MKRETARLMRMGKKEPNSQETKTHVKKEILLAIDNLIVAARYDDDKEEFKKQRARVAKLFGL
jgi:hypothetical protein